jgi:hypothetical protein
VIKEIKANSFKGRALKRYLGIKDDQASNNSASSNNKVTFSILTNIVILISTANIRKEDSWIINTGG